MAHRLYRAAAIAGVDESDQIGNVPDKSPLQLHAEAAMNALADAVPYVTAIVELHEGPRMMTNIVIQNPTPENVKVGMPVQVVFDDITEETSLPKFRPV